MSRPKGVGPLAALWLRLASWWVPAPERETWLETWRAEVAATRAAGRPWDRRLALLAGAPIDAVHYRFEETSMEGWKGEVRYALRGLLHRPGFAVITALTLGLGIGANTAIFSVVNGVVLQPLPYPQPDELVQVSSAFPTMDFEEFWISPPEFFELGERVRSFEAVGGYRHGQSNVGGGDQPERVISSSATASLFQVLGVQPYLGRLYTREEDMPGGDAVVMLSHSLWERTFGGDADVVGRSIEVNGTLRTVVGVMPPGFDLEDGGVELWVPMGLDPANRENRGSHFLRVIARLGPGVTPDAARTELTQHVVQWEEINPGTHTPHPEFHPMNLIPLREEVVGDVRQALLLLLGAVGFVLLIACANVANLLLARAEDRQKEVAVRVAMGAGRGRLMRQFLAEGILLAAVGAVVGLGVAWGSLQVLQAVSPGGIPRLDEIALDAPVLLFTTAVALLTGVFFGLAPARHMAAGAVAGSLRDGGQRSTAGQGRARLRSLLVVSEVALALILAVGSGLMIRSFQALNQVEPGFDADNLLTFQLYLPGGAYDGGAEIVAFHERLASQLGGLPGVRSVAAMSGLPPQRDLNANDTEFEGLERTQDGPPHNVDFYQTASASYLETMGIALVEGRGFLPSDGPDGVPVVLVNETLARLFYPGESALGRRIRPCCGDEVPWFEIVGVVDDVKQAGLDEPAGTEMYFHLAQVPRFDATPRTMNVVVRTAGPPTALTGAARETVGQLDPSLPLSGLRTMDQVLSISTARPRFLTLVMGVFAGLALTLAAVGTYGVMAYSVAQRGRELGIRIALGAEHGRVLGLVMRQGLGLALVGLVLGTGGALVLAGVMESLLFEVQARDPLSFVLGPVLLGAVAVLACWIPARRATRVDPVTVLRED